MLDCTAGPATGDPYYAPPEIQPFLAAVGLDPPQLRIAVTVDTFAGDPVDPVCSQATLDTATLLDQLGHKVEIDAPQFDVAAYARAHAVVLSANLAAFMEDIGRQLGRTPGPETLEPMSEWVLDEGRRLAAGDLVRAQCALNTTARQIAPFFDSYDILLTPTLASPPPPIGYLFGEADGAELRRPYACLRAVYARFQWDRAARAELARQLGPGRASHRRPTDSALRRRCAVAPARGPARASASLATTAANDRWSSGQADRQRRATGIQQLRGERQ